MPRSGPGPVTGLPDTLTRPVVAGSNPATTRSRVDLPQPDAPSRQMNSPRATTRSAPRNASTGP